MLIIVIQPKYVDYKGRIKTFNRGIDYHSVEMMESILTKKLGVALEIFLNYTNSGQKNF